MSVLSERPAIPVDTSHPASTPTTDTPIAIPDVVVNGKRPANSASVPHRRPKSSSSNHTTGSNNEWGSNFWVTLVDPQTQTQFYACPATGQVSWDPPVGSFLLPPNEDGEWWELTDDSRGGIPYYYQTKTGETVWERPDAFVIPLGILQNTSLARRLSARFGTSAQGYGHPPSPQGQEDRKKPLSTSSERPSGRKTRPPRIPVGDGSPEPRDPKRRSQSSTQSSGGRITPSTGSPIPKKTRHVVRRSFSSDQYGGFSQHINQLPTIPGSDASSVLSASASARRKSTSTLRSASYEKDCPPKNGSSSTRSKDKAYSTYRSPQPQSLNAAMELLSCPQGPSTSSSVRGNVGTKQGSPGMKQPPGHLSIPQKPAHLRPSQSVPATPTQPGRSASSAVNLHGKEISAPVLNEDAAMNMGPGKERANAQPILVEREARSKIPTERTNGTAMPILPHDLRSDIQQFVESDFAKRYFSTHRTGFIFRRTVPVTEMMSWQKALLNSPLLSLNKDLHKNAVRSFKVVQRIMGDRERDRTANRADSLGPLGNVNLNASTSSLVGSLGVLEEERWLLSEALTHGELRDEVYCQVVKQLIGNPSTESVFKGWQLLCVFLVTFPPSKNFETYLRSFITQRTAHSEGRVDVMAKYCLRRLAFISKKGPRGKAPTTAEIETASDAAFNPSIFGETLDIIYRLQQRTYPHQKVPIILPFLADGILALGGTKSEGIFRVPGDGDGVSELKLRIDRGYYTLEDVDDPHTLASLIKLWLRELCDPLVPEEMYNVCVSSSKLPEACVELVKQLPTINRRVVLFVISFLQLFLDDKVQATTKMTPANLALVMAPNLLRCNSDSMAVVFNNAQYEQEFVYHLLLHLKCGEIDPDYVPVHGQGAIMVSNQAQPRVSKSRNRR